MVGCLGEIIDDHAPVIMVKSRGTKKVQEQVVKNTQRKTLRDCVAVDGVLGCENKGIKWIAIKIEPGLEKILTIAKNKLISSAVAPFDCHLV